MTGDCFREITIDESKRIKGIAILLMIMLHVLYLGRNFEDEAYIGINVSCFSQPIEYYVGFFGQLCISIFCFLTGYVFSIKSEYGDNAPLLKCIVKKIGKIIIPYWIVLGLFCVCYLSMELKIDWKEFFLNVVALKTNLVFFSWYINFYIITILVFPIIKPLLLRVGKKPWLSIVGFIFLSIVFRFLNRMMYSTGIINENVYTILYHFYSYFPCVIIGFYSQQLQLIIPNRVIGSLILIIIALFRTFVFFKLDIGFAMDWLYIIPVICCIRAFTKDRRNKGGYILEFLGSISLYLWLYHSFFFGLNRTELLRIVYLPRFGIACVCWTVFILIPISMLTKKVITPLFSR